MEEIESRDSGCNMLVLSGALLALLVILFVAQYLKLQLSRGRFPPGPTPLPIIGNLGALGFELRHDALMKLAKTYGNIFTVWMGSTPVIVLNGCQSIRDGLISHSEEFSGRPPAPVFDRHSRGKGVIWTNGKTWKEHRRFALMTLRNLGLGNKILERRIQDESQHLLELFSALKGKAVEPQQIIVHALTNVISVVIFGHRFSSEDEVFLQLIESTSYLMRFIYSGWARDAADVTSIYDESNLVRISVELLGAGLETTTSTLDWALLYMATQLDIQEKVQQELDDVLGKSHVIEYEDRKRLPYTNAVLHEIQRHSNVQSIGILRQAVMETYLQGYHIEKGTIILANLPSSLYDQDYWESPQQFKPGHFLDRDGNFVTNEAFLPFSAGHRVCLGEQMARIELFIFFSNLLRAFTFRLPEGVKEVNMNYVFGATLRPHPYKICAVAR